MVLYGRDGAKMMFIISDNYKRIADRMLEEMDIGVTYISGSGAYSGKDKEVIMCVMKKQRSHMAEEIIREEDPGNKFPGITGFPGKSPNGRRVCCRQDELRCWGSTANEKKT